MRWGKRVVFVLLAVLLMLAALRPHPARADSLTTPLIISGAVAGGVAVIMLIAILASRDDEPELLGLAPEALARRPPVAAPSVRFGPRCRAENGAYALLCW